MNFIVDFARTLIAWIFRIVCGTTVFYRGSGPDLRQRIFYANHSSHLDFILLWSALPSEIRCRTRPVAAADYWLSSALKKFLAVKIFQAVLIDRKSGNPEAALQIMLEAIDRGDSLIIFPEGTRSLDGEMQQFKSGLFYLHQARPNISLLPVYLENLNRILPKGDFILVPLLSKVIIGDELRVPQGIDKTDFLNISSNSLLQLKDAT